MQPQAKSAMRIVTTAIAFAAFVASINAGAQGQNYPNKPIRVVVPYSAGGSPDVVGRAIGAKLSEAWGQQMVLDNRPGASGNIGTDHVAKSIPDGYTLLLATDIQMAINPHVYKALPFNPDRDFAPIVQVAFIEFILSLHPSVPASSVKELIAYAKANPGKISYASTGIGSTHQLAIEWLKSLAGIDMLHIPYKGSGQILPDLISGQVQLSYTGIPQTMPHVRSGKLKALAIGAAKPLAAAPGIPPIAETIPGFEANASWNFFAPAGTPLDIVTKLNTEINRILALPEVSERLISQGLIPIGGSPGQLTARMKSDYVKWGKVVREIGLKPE